MFPLEILVAYVAAVLVVVFAPGPDNILAIILGAIFAIVTALIFSLLGIFSARLSAWLSRRPRVVAAANIGAGFTFIAAGLSILALGRKP